MRFEDKQLLMGFAKEAGFGDFTKNRKFAPASTPKTAPKPASIHSAKPSQGVLTPPKPSAPVPQATPTALNYSLQSPPATPAPKKPQSQVMTPEQIDHEMRKAYAKYQPEHLVDPKYKQYAHREPVPEYVGPALPEDRGTQLDQIDQGMRRAYAQFTPAQFVHPDYRQYMPRR